MSWVWATADHSRPVALSAAVDENYVAFVNGDAEAELWGRTYRAGPGVERSAAAEFIATAYACAAAADPARDRAITVIGEGLLAQLVRGMLPSSTRTAPDVVIDTTGSPDRIREVVATLGRLGHLVLAAPPRSAAIDLATYRDLHVRALTIKGVAWVSDPVAGAVADVAVDGALERLIRVTSGRPAQHGAWYAVHGAEPA